MRLTKKDIDMINGNLNNGISLSWMATNIYKITPQALNKRLKKVAVRKQSVKYQLIDEVEKR